MGVRGLKKKTTIKFTEEYIQSKLNFFLSESAQKYNMDNLYIFDWESDKLIKTKSGYLYEFEIKVSRDDFHNDFKNKQNKHLILEGKEEERKPNYFYYAVPEGLIDVDEIPSYAGLVYIKEDGYGINGLRIVRTAPKLHGVKYSDEELGLIDKFYYNMKSYKDKYGKEKDRRLLTEENHKIPYAELYEKYEELKKDYKDIKDKENNLSNEIRFASQTIRDDNRIIRALYERISKHEPNFNMAEFEKMVLGE